MKYDQDSLDVQHGETINILDDGDNLVLHATFQEIGFPVSATTKPTDQAIAIPPQPQTSTRTHREVVNHVIQNGGT